MSVELKWLNSFAIGVKQIDNDHKEILGIMIEIKSAIDNKNHDLCKLALSKLQKKVAAHFIMEEELLRTYDYPELEGHIEFHSKLLTQFEAITETCNKAIDQSNQVACIDDLAQFLIDDIIVGDSEYRSFFASKGLD